MTPPQHHHQYHQSLALTLDLKTSTSTMAAGSLPIIIIITSPSHSQDISRNLVRLKYWRTRTLVLNSYSLFLVNHVPIASETINIVLYPMYYSYKHHIIVQIQNHVFLVQMYFVSQIK